MKSSIFCSIYIFLLFSGCVSEIEKIYNSDNAYEYAPDTLIEFVDGSPKVDGGGVSVEGNIITITAAGNFTISGTMPDGQIIVNTKSNRTVRLILRGLDITCSNNAPIYIKEAENTVIVLEDGTENFITDGESYVLKDPGATEPDAAIFSKDDLTIEGNGSLSVNANYNDGIKSKDDLIIKSGSITVNSVDDGIQGKDCLIIKNGNITINAEDDGLKSTNYEDTGKGFISIENGVINIVSGGDGVQAETNVLISDGEFNITSGGGSNNSISGDASAKGVKADVSLTVDSGTFTINSADDAIHSNKSIVINGGAFTISSGDDGIRADCDVEVNGGDINISKSYEGIESSIVTMNNGNIHIVSEDDGINAMGENATGEYYVYINGAYIVIDSTDDAIDSNGHIEMTDGVLLASGPTTVGSVLDFDLSLKLSGGFLIATAVKAWPPSASSTQYSVVLNFSTSLPADTLVHVQESSGKVIFTFMPYKTYKMIEFSSPELKQGTSYDVYYGGSSNGTAVDGLYHDGTYTPGTKFTSFTISNIVTEVQ